jgi:penicillin amidase
MLRSALMLDVTTNTSGESSHMPTIDGPRGSISYTRDAYGYPSIDARDVFDGAYARGYLHATDRLAQISLTKTAASGRMMALLGDEPFARTIDRSVRLLDLKRDIDTQLDEASDYTRDILHAYCEGFNAALPLRPMPMLLRTLGLEADPHTPEDVFLLHRMISFFGLTSMQQTAELAVMELAADGANPELFELLLGDAGEGIDLEALGDVEVPELVRLLSPSPAGGSNAFAVSADRSATDGALLMGEMHLEVGQFPPLMYASHEHYSPGSFYQGMGFPGVPWLSMGRTNDVGWSYTYGHADNIDIIIEKCRSGRFKAGDTWRDFTRRTETVDIRGEDSETWVFHDNDYGTVAGDARSGKRPCVRWTGLHESTADDLQMAFDAVACETVDEIIDVHRNLGTLSLGAVVADRHGDIGRVHTGTVDQRPDGWTGAYPLPGWDLESRNPDPIPESERPVIVRPEQGFVASANEDVDSPGDDHWCNFPEPEYRYRRIVERLESNDHPDLRDLASISYDETDLAARDLMAVWEPLLPDDPAVTQLATWAANQPDDPTPKSRRQMGLFHALHQEAVRELLNRYLDDATSTRLLEQLGLLVTYQHNLDPVLAGERPDLLDESELREILHTAWPSANQRVDDGDWPLPVRARFTHQLEQGALPTGLGFSSEEIDFPGAPTASFQSRVVAFEGESMMFGPAFHMVFDMSETGAWYHVPGGAAETPLGPGYGAGVLDWRDGNFERLGGSGRWEPSVRGDDS